MGLWINQFNQIDDTGKDIFEPKLITAIPYCSNAESIVFHWAGWADLWCNFPLLLFSFHVSR
jgi:hypothetical protein